MSTATAAGTMPTTDTGAPNCRRLAALGGGVAVVGSAIFLAGLATTPTTVDDSQVELARSLAHQPVLAQVSALLLHYGNLLLGVGVLVFPVLVRGARGGVLALAGALLTGLVLLNRAGSILTDWWEMTLAQQLSPEQAAALTDQALGHQLLTPWTMTEMLFPVGLVLLFVGLARAGVLGGWTVPAVALGSAGPFVAPLDVPGALAAVSLLLLVPVALAGSRLVQRSRLPRRPTHPA